MNGRKVALLMIWPARAISTNPIADASDVFFYRERPQVAFADLPQLGLMAEEVYKQMTASGQFTPHTRTDIRDWTAGR